MDEEKADFGVIGPSEPPIIVTLLVIAIMLIVAYLFLKWMI